MGGDLADPLRACDSIAQIALACGFSDLGHFSRRQPDAFGASPRGSWCSEATACSEQAATTGASRRTASKGRPERLTRHAASAECRYRKTDKRGRTYESGPIIRRRRLGHDRDRRSGIGFAYVEAMANGARVRSMDKDAQSLDAAVHRLAERGSDVRGQTLDVTTARRCARACGGRRSLTWCSPMSASISPPGFLSMTGDRNPDARSKKSTSADLVMATDLAPRSTPRSGQRSAHEEECKGRAHHRYDLGGGHSQRSDCRHAHMPRRAAHLVRQAALELAKYNILVNAIALDRS